LDGSALALLRKKNIILFGWMLKVASDQEPKTVFEYVMRHKKEMPRTALRYAIEKLSPDLRKQAMAKELGVEITANICFIFISRRFL